MAQLLQYPLEKQNKYRGRISFQPLEVIPVEDAAVEALKKVRVDSQGNWSESENVQNYEDFVSANVSNNIGIQTQIGKNQIDFGLRVRRIQEYCRLYIPTGLAFNDLINLSNPALGVSGASTLGALSAGGGVLESVLRGAGNAGRAFIDTFTGGLEADVAKVAAARAAQRFTTERTQSAVQIGLQVASNPNQRSIFNSVNIRTFTFAFKFVPLSARESTEIENIIEWFRKEMYPEQIEFSTTSVPFGYKFPNLFDVKIGYDTNNNGSYRPLKNMEILPCYLQSIQHNYNSSSMTWHRGGKPTEVDMNLTFVEYRTLHKKDITNPYSTQFDENNEARIQA